MFQKFKALQGISMDIYEGQITALLGRRGVGKTTIMSIITGKTSMVQYTVFKNVYN